MAETTTTANKLVPQLQQLYGNGNMIWVSRPGADSVQGVAISFKRTVRVADNNDTNHLPPGLGTFPIYRTDDFMKTLPRQMAAKGGFFIPMYRK